MSEQEATNYFSISSDLIVTGAELGYDIFINASGADSKQHFVRVFPKNQDIGPEDVQRLKEKYHQLYVPEKQRKQYLDSIMMSNRFSKVEKSEVVKKAAIQHLDNLFNPEKEFTTDVLNESMDGCRETVSAMVDVVQDYDIRGLQDHIAQLSFHDFYTYDHSINVSMYCISILKTILPSSEKRELVTVGLGGLFHDLGKTKIPTHLLNKSGKLTEEEFETMKRHTDYGMALLSQNGIETPEGVNLEVIRRVVYEHHENFNGTGYPQGLAGDDIHVMARITAISDFFDAVTTKRSYHEARPIADALKLMEKSKGKKLDPRLFDQFTKQVLHLMGEARLEAQLPDDFDPCRPHDQLPLQRLKSASPVTKISSKSKKPDLSQFRSRSTTSKIIKSGK